MFESRGAFAACYNGVGSVVGEDYPEPDIMWNRYGTTSGSYPDLDRFNRVTSSRWTTDLTPTDVDFYDIDITYDRNSNITLIEDHVHAGFDVDYTNDNLNRLTQAEEGTWNSGTSQIDSRTRNQVWTLDQVGNWDVGKLDLDGDNNFNETNEYNDDRTHNVVNELTARDTDDNGTDDFTLTYDAVGNLTDDGENYEYVYDVFGRLRKINDESDQSLVAEYRYNGLGYKISQHQDTDTDGDVDANDKWFHGVYDTSWRMVAIFRDDDTDPKEQFVHHNAGADGLGGSSYIDRVILRDRDNSNGPTGAPDGTLEERRYYCQNWRHDVSAVVTSGGVLVEWGKYSSYGVPFGLPGADTDSDGDCDATDITQIQTWINASTYDVRADLDLDGDVDSTDKTNAQNNYQGITLGWNVMSGVRRQHGYAGYEWDAAVSKYHVRNRVLDSHLGRWNRRDPLGYVDGMSVYAYVQARALASTDASGAGPLRWIRKRVRKVIEDLINRLRSGFAVGGRVCSPPIWGVQACVMFSVNTWVFPCRCCGTNLQEQGSAMISEFCVGPEFGVAKLPGKGAIKGPLLGGDLATTCCPSRSCRWIGCFTVSFGVGGMAVGCRICSGGSGLSYVCGIGIGGSGTGVGGQLCRRCSRSTCPYDGIPVK